jgi:RNA polymerase sigma factor (sigma-70 family)
LGALLIQEQSARILSLREVWQEIANGHKLDNSAPEDIVKGCRSMDPVADDRLRGQLLNYLRIRAERYLIARVDKSLPDQGRGAVDAVLDGMVEAILSPGSADGLGYETAFYPKLRQRLIDQVRKLRKQQQRFEEPKVDEEGDEVTEPADFLGLTPEDVATIDSIVKNLPERHRKAFSLHRLGYPCSSTKKASIAQMMSISGKTAEKLVNEAHEMLKKHLGQ